MTAGGTRRMRVAASHPALPGHFPGAPIVPAAWQLIVVEQVCRDVLGAELRVAGVASARFRAPWRPDTDVTISVTSIGPERVRFSVDAGGRLAEGIVVVARKECRP